MKTVAIIQARMSSIRLPDKIMADIIGKPMLSHVVNRAQQAKHLDLVVVATSVHPQDDLVVTFCRKEGIPYFRGSLDDVLDRYYHAARHYDADVVVRLTADCPLLDPSVIDQIVQVFRSGQYDYVSNTIQPTYPDGLDTEVFRFDVLEQTWREARLKSEREHVTPYIKKQTALFRLHNVENDQDLSSLRWTVDRPEDLEFVRAVYGYLSKTASFGVNEVLSLIEEHPELPMINAGFERNEGYIKSLREDASTG
jgi:spore coat polysaccharide biosynthesis protein SpsF